MSRHPDYHPPAATDTLTGVRRPKAYDQRSPSTSLQPSSPTTLFGDLISPSPSTLLGDLVSPSPSSGLAGLTCDTPFASPSTLYPGPASRSVTLGASEQSLTPGSPSTGSTRDTGGESGDGLFRVSFATEGDLAELSAIYAGVSMADPLAYCVIKRRDRPYTHQVAGRFYYGQAFAAKGQDVVLKVTNQASGHTVGCAWLQLLLPYPESDEIGVLPWQPGSIVPDCIEEDVYSYIHRLRHKQIQTTIKEKQRQTNDLPYYLIRSLDVPNNLSTDHQLEVHRRLLSFISGFKPEHRIFAQVSHAFQPEMITFLDLGWAFIGDLLLAEDECPLNVSPSLRSCPVAYRTLSGFLRPETAEPPQAETSPPVAAAEIRPPRAPPLPPPTISAGGPASGEADSNDSRTQGELMLPGLFAASSGQEAPQDALHDDDALSSSTGQPIPALVHQNGDPQTPARRRQPQRSSSNRTNEESQQQQRVTRQSYRTRNNVSPPNGHHHHQ